jgi:hypothetical protein
MSEYEQEILARYSTSSLRKNTLSRTEKKWHLWGIDKKIVSDAEAKELGLTYDERENLLSDRIETILDQLFPEEKGNG